MEATNPEEASTTPIETDRTRNVLAVEVDTAGRYGDLYHLLTAAECIPAGVDEDLDACRWELVFESITEAQKAERIAMKANRLVTA